MPLNKIVVIYNDTVIQTGCSYCKARLCGCPEVFFNEKKNVSVQVVFSNTMGALQMDILVSRQFYQWMPSQNPFFSELP